MSEEIYYLHIDGMQKGPFLKENLLAEGLRSETMVWRPGLESWVKAASLPELSNLLNHFSQPGEATCEPPQPDFYGNPNINHGGQHSHQANTNGWQQNPQNPPGYSYGQQPNPYPHYNQNTVMPGSYPYGWTNWLGWAIAATILGFFCYIILCVPGIIGIVKANEANSLARMGDPRAAAVNSTAKAWTLVGLILSGLCILAATAILILFGAFVMNLTDIATGY